MFYECRCKDTNKNGYGERKCVKRGDVGAEKSIFTYLYFFILNLFCFFEEKY